MQTIGPSLPPVHVARSPLTRSSLFNGQVSIVVQTDYASPTSDTYPQYSWSQETLSPMVIPRASFSTVSEDDSREVDSQPPGMGDHWGHIPWHRSSMEDRSSNHSWSQQPSMRPQTPQSVHSWWSDSNSIGATMSIHAAAKPLIRLMYHRQATNFIDKNRGASLSPQTMDIYSRYLGYKYIGATTKAAILRDLESRVSEDDTDVMIDSLSVQSDLAEGLVNSPHIEVRRSTCRILARLVLLESRSAFTFGAISCLVSLLSDKDPATVDTAIGALSSFIQLSDSTEASMDVRLVNKLLESPNDQIFEVTCGMLKRTALSQCENLVALLGSHDNPEILGAAINGLTSLLQWSDGAEAAINAGLIEKLLESSTPWMTRSSRPLLQGLVLASVFPCESLVCRLRDSDHDIERRAIYALSFFIRHPDGAQAAMKAGILEFLDKFVDSPNTWILRSTCLMLGHLVRSDSTLVIVVSDSLCEFFMSRLRDENVEITESAISALARFAGFVVSPDAVEILVNAILPDLHRLLESPNARVQQDTCQMLGLLAGYETGKLALLNLNTCDHLASLLPREDSEVVAHALSALASIAEWPEGAAAVVGTGALGHLDGLISSRNNHVRKCTYQLLGNLAYHPLQGPNTFSSGTMAL
ncbi:armadillo-type protein [Mycena leptocephala]|nr:armadillo-type protein [Mycena leptocephala]